MADNRGSVEFTDSTKDNAPSSKMIQQLSRELSKQLSRKDSTKIQKENFNFGIPSRASVVNTTAELRSHESWRKRTLDFLHKKWVQDVFMSLLILDILIIFTELFLMIEFPTCRLVTRDCISCCGEEDHGDEEHFRRWLASSDGGHGDDHQTCPSAYTPTGVPGCDSHKYATIHTIENVLFYITVAILALFLIENLVEMAALGPCVFFKQIFLAADFFVVLISLVLELTFKHLKSDLAELVGILVLFRIWRFIRIGHGIIEITSELTNEYYDPLIQYAKKCEEKLKDSNVELPERSEAVEEQMKTHH